MHYCAGPAFLKVKRFLISRNYFMIYVHVILSAVSEVLQLELLFGSDNLLFNYIAI
jgi:hypothetical protein